MLDQRNPPRNLFSINAKEISQACSDQIKQVSEREEITTLVDNQKPQAKHKIEN